MLNAIGLAERRRRGLPRGEAAEAARARRDGHRQRLGRPRRGLRHGRAARSRTPTGSRPSSSTSPAPTCREGGMLFGNSPPATALARLAACARRRSGRSSSSSRPTPRTSSSPRARRARRGADILSLVNTFVGMAIDPETAPPRTSLRHRRALGPGDPAAGRAHGLPGAQGAARAFR